MTACHVRSDSKRESPKVGWGWGDKPGILEQRVELVLRLWKS